MPEPKPHLRIAGLVARAFINSKLTPLFIAGALLAGAFAILMTPREEEPQIIVPMLDVMVQHAGRVSGGDSRSASPSQWRSCCAKFRRGVRLLDFATRHEHVDRPLLRRHQGRRRDRQDVQQAVLQLRPHSAGRLAATDQGALDRRCSHPGADVVGRALRQLSTAAGCGRTGAPAQADRRRFGNEDHRRTATAGAGCARHPTPGRLWHDRRSGDVRSCSRPTHAALPAASPRTIRSSRSRPDASWATPTI